MRWVKLSTVLLTLLALAAFGVQNSPRTTQLSFDLGFAAWKLEAPASVPIVMGICFAAGALVTAIGGLKKRYELGRRVRQLEQELALRGARPAEKAEDDKGGWG